MINLKTKKFEDVTFALGVLQGAVSIPSAVPQMQPMYQQGMLDLEATLFYARVGMISFDGISDLLDLLHAT